MAEKWAYHGTDHFREERTRFLQSRGSRREVVKLHLGCGNKILRDYVNVDNVGSPDLKADITALPYEENSVDEILCVHTIEHIFPWKVEELLKHWLKLLKPDGKLILEMPDLRKVLEFFKQDKWSLSHTMNALYGGEHTGRIEDVHKWAWTFPTLEPVLKAAGYREIVEKPALYHVMERDFRVEAVK